MQRVTISLDEALAHVFDQVVIERGYASRSEAMRDLVRQAVTARDIADPTGADCVASLSYVYDFRTRALAQRLLEMQHANHDLVIAATHIILDHASSLVTLALRGPAGAVRRFADAIRAERGVRFGAINLITVEPNDRHNHHDAHHHHDLRHSSPQHG